MNKNIVTIVLSVLLLTSSLLYIRTCNSEKISNNLLKASLDTTHFYKTEIGNQGAYISTLQGSKKDIELVLKNRKDSLSKEILDSLKRDSKIQSYSALTGVINHTDKVKLDSSQKRVNLTDTIKNKNYTNIITIKNDSLTSELKNQRFEINLLTKNIPNKGLFSGSTLTTYATSKDPDIDITGLTSVSTQIVKKGLAIRPAIGIGLNSNIKGSNIRLGYNVGLVLTIK